MRNRIFMLTAASLVCAASALSSCSVWDKYILNKRDVPAIPATNKQEKPSAATDNKTTTKPTAKPTTTEKNPQETTTLLPGDREQLAVRKEQKFFTPEEIKSGVLRGDWSIESVLHKTAVGEKAPFLKFVPEQKRIYGNNGCNVINATYTINPADSTLRFGNIASTMILCHKEGITDTEINVALDAVRYYVVEMRGNDYWVQLLGADHRPVMELMHQNFQFLNGTWNIAAVGSTKVDNPDMKIVIDVDEGKIHGNTGCNIFNGILETDMETPNSISFSEIGVTKMACPDAKGEMELMVALEEASSARAISSKEVILYDSQKKAVMRLVRSTDK